MPTHGPSLLDAIDRPPPSRGPKIVSNGVAGMFLFVSAEAMLFMGLISAHAIVQARAVGQMWPPYGQPRLPVEETALNTAALLLSGVLMMVTHTTFKSEPEEAEKPMLVALLLGAFFVTFQGVEWVALIKEGLTLTSSTFGGLFYLIVGTHALHAVAAILCLGWAWLRLRRGRLTATQLATVELFWYFVVLVWPVLYLEVYL